MKLREIAPLVLMVVLGGCSGADWDHAISYVGLGGGDEQAQPPSPPPSGQADTAPLSTAEDAPAAHPWTTVGALPPSSQTAVAEPLPPPRAAEAESVPPPAAEPVPPPRPHVAASAPPAVFTPPVAAPAPSAVEPPPAAPTADPWCSRIAKSASDEAANEGFDAATQRHRAEVTYKQCVGDGN